MFILIIIVVLFPIIFYIIMKISTYNRLVELLEEIEESKKNLFAEYNNRADFVIEMERIAKVGSDVEEKILDKVLKARENAIKQNNFADRVVSENTLAKELGSAVTILVENYPTVSTTGLYRDVIKGLKDKTDSIQAAIRVHTANIRAYNVRRKSFAGQMFAPVSSPEKIEYPALEKLEDKKLTELLSESSQRPSLPKNHKEEAENNDE